jgi:hypothetical protein
LELSSLPDSSNLDELDKEDAWYNIPSNSEDKDDNSITLSFTLPLRLLTTSIAFTIPDIIYKEHSTSTRIKAIYILEKRRFISDIKKAIGVSRTRVYKLTSLAR